MKRLVVVGMLWSSLAGAQDWAAMTAQNPQPVYPRELSAMGIEGQAKVQFLVWGRDGSVSDVKVLSSDHPLFAQAAEAAIKQWHYKPWKMSQSETYGQELTAPFIFKLDEQQRLRLMYAQAQVLLINCAQFAEEAQAYRQAHVGQPMGLMPTVALSVGMLAKGKAQEHAGAKASFAQALPQIEQTCAEDPQWKYVDAWPGPLRAKALGA
ncbi:energy transducer TonB [Pseudomonas fontis]|uniref:Protein TonB n=1 Tax=Pseudomonas fontis TaxID=2942633 RepID=A0ABT5NRL8_9PSED|nr:energy transducer TonB [Pseudomonas fontis]MDD0973523.1 energy transducer TonB [Pseudomonas fontis]MDD0990820.1 energy transducer TonB [Pseudomonas fontis]